MGTASFGGGSGSIGGGGSGSGGAGGSLLRAIENLREISRRLMADGDQARLTREVNVLLRHRGRASSVKTLLSDGFADALFGDLLDVKRRLDENERWADIAAAYGVTTGARSLEAFCDNRIDAAQRAHDYALDDRSVERGSAAFRHFMASAIGGDLNVADQGDAAAIDASLNRAYFNNTAGYFLGDLLAKVVAADSVLPLGAATPAVEMATHTVAIAIYDRFDRKFVRKEKAVPRDVLKILAENYADLVTGS
ncbi:MAG TPA: hypothetical protein VGD66_13435 [Allosphingosinicella sp.]|jgi:hypothetical protein